MNTLAHWISPETMQVLSWTLVHFLWQGAALAALLWFALTAIRNASGRYVASVIVLVLMLAAPVFTFVSLASQTGETDNAPNIRLVHSISTSVMTAAPVAEQATRPSAVMSITPWLVEGWLIGVVALSLRSAAGCCCSDDCVGKLHARLAPLLRMRASPCSDGWDCVSSSSIARATRSMRLP